MNLIAAIKSKILSILCVVLFTALTTVYLSGSADRTELKDIRAKLVQHVELNESLSRQNLELAEEIRTKPTEYITITKEVEKEVCKGQVAQAMIKALPSKRKEGVNEKVTADIDDRLPDDLLKLLK